MKNKLFIFTLVLFLLFTSTSYPVVASSGSGNMEGNGGGMEQTGGGNNNGGNSSGAMGWNEGQEGIRVSVIEKESKQTVGIAFDWSNFSVNSYKPFHFGKTNKLEYQRGDVLTPIFEGYTAKKPTTAIPPIISSNGSTNIAAVKAYFEDANIVDEICQHINMDATTVTNGNFTIILEPIAYFTYAGNQFAMTATEVALYDKTVSGNLRANMGYLTHQNLPLAMYLEMDELGIHAYGGGVSVKDNTLLFNQLGIGTVNFDDPLVPPDLSGNPSVETPAGVQEVDYHTDTEVVSTISICTDTEINPDEVGEATFGLPSGSIIKEYVIPVDKCQLVWVKWTTPSEEGIVDIPISTTDGSTDTTIIRANITKLEENLPPDPKGRDRNDGFTPPAIPTAEQTSSLAWIEWYATWESDWKQTSALCDSTCEPDCRIIHSEWVDEGYWDFEHTEYSASVNVTARTFPDGRVPTAAGNTIKSGYGINTEVIVTMDTNSGSSGVTEVQHIVTTFPEFRYETYNRFLEQSSGTTWQFKENEFSQFRNPVHFTPVWFPDNASYVTAYTIFDAWTPAGQLYFVVTADDITINANVFDDWHTAPSFN